MKIIQNLVLIFLLLFVATKPLKGQEIHLIPTDIKASFRGLSVVDDSVAWLSGTQGTFGRTVNGGKNWQFSSIPGFEKSDFRSLYAFDSLTALVGNTGSPAIILRTENGGKSWKEVYRNAHPDAFLDGIGFWDENSGMVYGDPIFRKLLILKTSDAGKSWTEVPEKERPTLDSGEASFAASGTNLRLWERKKVAIATGGLKSRIWLSENSGKNWKAISVPILQRKDSRGIFSFAVSGQNWIVVGGDYQIDSLKKDHVFYSKDGGKTWEFPAKPTGGYRECIENLPKDKCLAIGPGGVDLSEDEGQNWFNISTEKGFHVAQKARRGKLVLLAGAKGKVAILE